MRVRAAKMAMRPVLLLVAIVVPVLLFTETALSKESRLRITNITAPVKVRTGQGFSVTVSVEWSGLYEWTDRPSYWFTVDICEGSSYDKARRLAIKTYPISESSGAKTCRLELTAPVSARLWQLTVSFGVSCDMYMTYTSPTTTVHMILKDVFMDQVRNVLSVNVADKATIVIETRPEKAYLPISIDGYSVSTDANGRARHELTLDQKYTIQVPSEFSVGPGVRIVFVRWQDGETSVSRTIALSDDVTLTVEYKTQYLLTVISQIGMPQGSGWHDDGATVSFSVASSWPLEGFLGTLGGKYVFQRWSGDYTASTASASIVMDKPKTVTAEWNTDAATPYTVGMIGTVVIIAGGWVIFMRKRRRLQRTVDSSLQAT